MLYTITTPFWACLGFSLPNHSTGPDNRLLAFEVTRLRNVVGLVVLVLFQTEKNINKHSIPPRKRKSIPAGRGSENGRGAGLRGPISNFVRPARRPRRCRPYLSFQLQIIQNSSSTHERVPQPRGNIQNRLLPAPLTASTHSIFLASAYYFPG